MFDELGNKMAASQMYGNGWATKYYFGTIGMRADGMRQQLGIFKMYF